MGIKNFSIFLAFSFKRLFFVSPADNVPPFFLFPYHLDQNSYRTFPQYSPSLLLLENIRSAHFYYSQCLLSLLLLLPLYSPVPLFPCSNRRKWNFSLFTEKLPLSNIFHVFICFSFKLNI